MSDLFGGEERFSKFLADVEASTSIKVTGGDDTSSAEPAMPEEAPVEVLEDNAANDEKLGQDMQDTTEDISSDAEGVEHYASLYDNFSAFGQHVKKYDLSKDVYAFMNVSTGYVAAVTANGYTVPAVDKYTNTATNKAAVMEANDGMLARMRTAIVNFFKSLWENIKKFGGFLKGYLDKAWEGIKSLGTAIKNIPSNVRSKLKVKADAKFAKQFFDGASQVDSFFDGVQTSFDKIDVNADPAATIEVIQNVVNMSSSQESGDGTIDMTVEQVTTVIENAEKQLSKKDRILASINKLGAGVKGIIGKLSGTNTNDGDANQKLSMYKRLAGVISKAISSVNGMFTRMVSFARRIGNGIMQMFQKEPSGVQTTPA